MYLNYVIHLLVFRLLCRAVGIFSEQRLNMYTLNIVILSVASFLCTVVCYIEMLARPFPIQNPKTEVEATGFFTSSLNKH